MSNNKNIITSTDRSDYIGATEQNVLKLFLWIMEGAGSEIPVTPEPQLHNGLIIY